jgi:hypothetical protein
MMKPAKHSPEVLEWLNELHRQPYPKGFGKPEQSSDSELLTPSKIASLRKDMQESAQLADELFSDEKWG